MRPSHLSGLLALAALAACTRAPAPATAPQPAAPAAATQVRQADVREQLEALAADSMEGRATGSAGGMRAAVYLARRLEAMGVQPAGDMAYFQLVPVAENGGRLRLMESLDALAEVPAEQRRQAFNVIGMVPGSDPALRHEAVIVGAHYDHVGIGRAVDGDSIYNGADDDGSGSVAVLEVARALARGPAPRRTVVFFFATGEEVGMLGTRWYLRHPVVALDSTVAGLMIEMIGRPDSLAGGPGRAWLTGYERSTVSQILAGAGVPIVPDPRPDQDFFNRSDNTPFALQGVPAHALSSFGLHADYHQPGDETERIDWDHMTRVVQAAMDATRALADGPRPQWAPGGRPTR
ncbi:M20/M25/M40 family metallo-hydrolase [Longimicrobium sp.]|uniref:M20/M25/M40 family metallo-hydrolase n=1 Tax=Longimicrobium sp. TaxID=2029185 RepID=UPI003B3B5156